MCEAIEAMLKESQEKAKLELLVGLVKDGLLTIRDAAARVNMSEDEFRDVMKKTGLIDYP